MSSPVNVLEKSEEETVALGPYISIDADHAAALILAPLCLSVLTRQNTPILITGSAGDWLIETTAGQKYVVKKADFETKFSDIVTAYEYPRQ